MDYRNIHDRQIPDPRLGRYPPPQRYIDRPPLNLPHDPAARVNKEAHDRRKGERIEDRKEERKEERKTTVNEERKATINEGDKEAVIQKKSISAKDAVVEDCKLVANILNDYANLQYNEEIALNNLFIQKNYSIF